MSAPPQILLSRCDGCGLPYLPGEGPCPRCGSSDGRPFPVPGIGVVLAATELSRPPEGWTAPHRIALIEVAESVRILAVIDGELPTIGDAVEVRRTSNVYRASGVPGGEETGARGEGDFPKAGRTGTSFEPPR